MKVFISYSTKDKPVAESLYEEMSEAGAEVFQFGRSETAGADAWEEILTWIGQSDVFIVLVSKSALSSPAVACEVKQANYTHINTGKPKKLIPAIVEKGASPPVLVERFNRVDLMDVAKGMKRLMGQLGLDKPARRAKGAKNVTRSAEKANAATKEPAPAKFQLPDFDRVLSNYDKPNPLSLAVQQWSADATKLVTSYNELKPKEIPKEKEARHIDSLLGDLSAKSDASKKPARVRALDEWFLNLSTPEPSKAASKPGERPSLSRYLLNYDASKTLLPLDAPDLKSTASGQLSWSKIAFASGYVLEESTDPEFKKSAEVYSGPQTTFSVSAPSEAWTVFLKSVGPIEKFYRVRARGTTLLGYEDSAWSNVVSPGASNPFANIKAPLKPVFTASAGLSAPELTASPGFGGTTLSWTVVKDAADYVLERSTGSEFSNPETIYEGPETSQTDFTWLGVRLSSVYFYRVKARGKGIRADSAWSSVVKLPDS